MLGKYTPKTNVGQWVVAFFIATIMLVPQMALAADDPFAKATEKTEDITALIITLAQAIAGIMIVIFGLLLITGNIKKELGIAIVIGSLVIGSAATISSFLFAT